MFSQWQDAETIDMTCKEKRTFIVILLKSQTTVDYWNYIFLLVSLNFVDDILKIVYFKNSKLIRQLKLITIRKGYKYDFLLAALLISKSP